MAKVTITIEGEPEEVRRTLRRLAGRGCHHHHGGGRCGHHHHHHHGGAEEGGEPIQWQGHHRRRRGRGPDHPGWLPWTAEELAQVWNEVTAGARRVLAEIAKRPDGYPAAELQQALGMDGKAIGGTLSSVGVVSRRYGERMPLYVFHWDLYRMRPRIAEAVRRLADSSAGETPPETEPK